MYKVCSPRYSTEKNKYQFTYPPIPKKNCQMLGKASVRLVHWYVYSNV